MTTISPNDEQAIRAVIERWHAATATGDVALVSQLMTDDVVFLTAGQPPLRGRAAFAAGMQAALARYRISSSATIQEVQIVDTLAYCWGYLLVTLIPHGGGRAIQRAGDVLTIFHKQPDATWLVVRDANLLVIVE